MKKGARHYLMRVLLALRDGVNEVVAVFHSNVGNLFQAIGNGGTEELIRLK